MHNKVILRTRHIYFIHLTLYIHNVCSTSNLNVRQIR